MLYSKIFKTRSVEESSPYFVNVTPSTFADNKTDNYLNYY